MKLIRGNKDHSPGIEIEKELRPFRKDNLLGYRMDIDILGKINFYGDPLIPQVRKIEDLKRQLAEKGETLVITSREAIEDLTKEGFQTTSIKIIKHKDIDLFLAKIQ